MKKLSIFDELKSFYAHECVPVGVLTEMGAVCDEEAVTELLDRQEAGEIAAVRSYYESAGYFELGE